MTEDGGAFVQVELNKIRPNPHQPRKHFDPEALAELAEDLKARNLLQPIGVRPAPWGFELIWGERRMRAAKLAGWTHILARVVTDNDRDSELDAVVENLHRQDLRPTEECEAYHALLGRVNGDVHALAAWLKKSERHVRERLVLRQLSPAMYKAAELGLPMVYAVPLSGLSHGAQKAAYDKIEGTGVKAWKRLVQALATKEAQPSLFTIKTITAEERHVLSKYDRMLAQLEDLLRRSFQKDELIVLARVLDARVPERARRMAAIASNLNLLRKALNRSHARVQVQREMKETA